MIFLITNFGSSVIHLNFKHINKEFEMVNHDKNKDMMTSAIKINEFSIKKNKKRNIILVRVINKIRKKIENIDYV